MSRETSSSVSANYSGDGLSSALSVWREDYNESKRAFSFGPYEPDSEQQVSPLTLTIEIKDRVISDSWRAASERHIGEAALNAVHYPHAEIIFGGDSDPTLKQISMLTYTALQNIELESTDIVAILGRPEDAYQIYRDNFGMEQGLVWRRQKEGLGLFTVETGYVGNVRDITSYAGKTLRAANINYAHYLPDASGVKTPSLETREA